jgi:hypothetical protein
VQFEEQAFSHTFGGAMPAPSTYPVYIDLTWREEIDLFVNGHVINSVRHNPAKPGQR